MRRVELGRKTLLIVTIFAGILLSIRYSLLQNGDPGPVHPLTPVRPAPTGKAVVVVGEISEFSVAGPQKQIPIILL